MEFYKITDFNAAFQIGIEKLVYDAIKEHSKKKKKKDKDDYTMPETLKLKQAFKILTKDIFVKL